jgi:plastocyanin
MVGIRRRRGALVATVAFTALGAVLAGCGGDVKGQHADVVRGKQLFVQRCGACHTLARAGTRGTVGPNLDAAFSESIAEGMGRDTVEGVVHEQILFPISRMPRRVVTGQSAADVAAYVGRAAAAAGQDEGALAKAVRVAGGGRAAAQNGRLEIDADPNGQLAYTVASATASVGALEIDSRNAASIPHDIALQQGTNGAELGHGPTVSNGGVSRLSVNLRPGTYTFFCTLPGHRAAGMEGTLTVR